MFDITKDWSVLADENSHSIRHVISNLFSYLGAHEEVKDAYPMLAQFFSNAEKPLYMAVRDMERTLVDQIAGRTPELLHDTQVEVLSHLLLICMKALPDTAHRFPKGKWATIQAWENQLIEP